MADLSKNFMSFVALGSQNPQILNVDFLKREKIVPIDQPPFNTLFQQKKPFSKFISTPVLSNLVLDTIEFIIDEQRFQIRDKSVADWIDTKILHIAQKYFEILKYTPLKVVGINMNSKITFSTSKEEETFQSLFLMQESKIVQVLSKSNILASTVLRYAYSDNGGRIALTIEQPKKINNERIVNFNYEFDFTDWKNFKSELTKFPDVPKYCDSVLNQLLEAI